jgi:hypothetical protein
MQCKEGIPIQSDPANEKIYDKNHDFPDVCKHKDNIPSHNEEPKVSYPMKYKG